MVAFDKAALTLVIIGALNWLLVGLFNFDLVTAIFGGSLLSETPPSVFSRIIFSLVGLAGLWCITLLFKRWHPNKGKD